MPSIYVDAFLLIISDTSMMNFLFCFQPHLIYLLMMSDRLRCKYFMFSASIFCTSTFVYYRVKIAQSFTASFCITFLLAPFHFVLNAPKLNY